MIIRKANNTITDNIWELMSSKLMEDSVASILNNKSVKLLKNTEIAIMVKFWQLMGH
jgi:hypothetical protein